MSNEFGGYCAHRGAREIFLAKNKFQFDTLYGMVDKWIQKEISEGNFSIEFKCFGLCDGFLHCNTPAKIEFVKRYVDMGFEIDIHSTGKVIIGWGYHKMYSSRVAL